jgi:hypothetical protein
MAWVSTVVSGSIGSRKNPFVPSKKHGNDQHPDAGKSLGHVPLAVSENKRRNVRVVLVVLDMDRGASRYAC